MIVKIGKRGKSFKGATLYYGQDKRQPGETKSLTADRVEWTETLNLANDDPAIAWREMWRTAVDQKELKREAGLRTGGNRTHSPVLPIVLSWAQPDKPTPEQQRTAAHQFLRKMGWEHHQALIFAHKDTDHQHVHILLNRVHPENGLVLTESFSHRHAQAWALQYQREHGQTWCPQREINARARAEGRRTQDNSQPYPLAKDAKNAHAPALHAEQDLAREARTEKELLSQHHQEEREAFLAGGLQQIHGIRTAVFLKARAEFKPQWRALHAAERNARGDAEALRQLKDARRDLWDEVRSVTRVRQDLAVKEFIAERRELFQEIKHRQRDERSELRSLLEARENGTPHDAKRLAELTGDRAGHAGQPGNDRSAPPHSPWPHAPANENQLDPQQRRGVDAERARQTALRQVALTRSQSLPAMQRVAMRELKDNVRRDRTPRETTDTQITRRIQEMRREDEERRARGRDGFGREREHYREKDR